MSLQSILQESNLVELDEKLNNLKRDKLLTEEEIIQLCKKVNKKAY